MQQGENTHTYIHKTLGEKYDYLHATRRKKRRNNPLQKWTDNSDGHNKGCHISNY